MCLVADVHRPLSCVIASPVQVLTRANSTSCDSQESAQEYEAQEKALNARLAASQREETAADARLDGAEATLEAQQEKLAVAQQRSADIAQR